MILPNKVSGHLPSRPPVQRGVAATLVIVYLFLSGVLAFETGNHLMDHGASAHHAKQHAKFYCTLMCATSSFVHSSEQTPEGRLGFLKETPIISAWIRPERPATFSFRIRPPPAFSA